MRKEIKRGVCVVMALLMMVSAFPAQAFEVRAADTEALETAETLETAEAPQDTESSGDEDTDAPDDEATLLSETYGDLYYSVQSDGTIAIIGCAQGATSIEIPSEIEGKSVTVIQYCAFQDCSALTSVTIPEGVTSIGTNAFSGCSGLTNVTVPESVTNIGGGVFFDCDHLTTAGPIGSGCSYQFGWTEKIPNYAFAGCGLTSVTIPDSVTFIGAYTFSGCSKLTSVTIPQGVTSIGYEAFFNCGALTSVTLSDGLKTIGIRTFYNCGALTDITIPESVKVIGDYAFYNCHSLKNVMIPQSLTSLGEWAFAYCLGLTSVTILGGVKNIREYAFYNCQSLTNATISQGVTSFKKYAFADCTALISVTIPDSVTSIGDYAFYNCHSLASVTIPDSVTSIGYNAFTYCSGLTSVTIPDSVTSMGSWIFYGCTGLTSAGPIGGGYDYQFGWSEYIPPGAFAGCYTLTSVMIPDSVTSIGANAFHDCYALKSLTIPNNVTSIGYDAFYGCEITLYVMPDSCAEKYAKEHEISCQYILDDGNLLTLTVKDGAGNSVTAGYAVRWYEKDGVVPVATGNSVWASADSAYEYELTLDDDLLFRYRSLGRTAVADSSVGAITCILETIPAVTITGRVTDTDGAAIPGASVTVRQSEGGRTRSQTVNADADGRFSADAFMLDTVVSVTAEGYYGRQRAFSLNDTANANLGTFQLEIVPENRFALTLTLQEAAENGQTPLETSLTATSGLTFAAYNRTRGAEIVGDLFQYPYLVIGSQAEAGDQIRITVTDANGGVTVEPTEAVYEANPNQPLEIRFVENGRIAATLSGVTDKRVLLFDSAGTFLRQYGADGGAFVSDSLTAGEYRLVFMEKSSLLNSVPSLSRLAELGLAEGTDYLLSNVTIENGKIANLGTLSTPALNPERLSRMDAEHTSVTANKASVSAGQIVTVRAQYRVKDRYLTDNQRLVIELPENCNPLNGGVSVNGNSAVYSLDGRTLTVQTDATEGTVFLMVSPEREGDYSISCFLAFDESGEKILQPLGAAFFTAAPIQINAPSATSKSGITVSGVTIGGASVTVYDGEKQLATTTANAAGKWFAEVELDDRYLYGVHYLHAASETSYGARSVSDAAKVIYDANHVDATSVTVMQNGQSVVVDMSRYASKTLSYTYNPSYPSFTFLVKFTEDDAEGLSDVAVITKNAAGEETRVPCSYQEGVGWTGAHSFSTDNLPVSVSVDYVRDTELSLLDESKASALFEDLRDLWLDAECETAEAITVGEVTQEKESECLVSVSSDSVQLGNVCLEALDYSEFDLAQWENYNYYYYASDDGSGYYVASYAENGILTQLYAFPGEQTFLRSTLELSGLSAQTAGLMSADKSVYQKMLDSYDIWGIVFESLPIVDKVTTTLNKTAEWHMLKTGLKSYHDDFRTTIDTTRKMLERAQLSPAEYAAFSARLQKSSEEITQQYSKRVWYAYTGSIATNLLINKGVEKLATSSKMVRFRQNVIDLEECLGKVLHYSGELSENEARAFIHTMWNGTNLSFKISDNMLANASEHYLRQFVGLFNPVQYMNIYYALLMEELYQLQADIIATHKTSGGSTDNADNLKNFGYFHSFSMQVLMTAIIDPSGYVCEAVPSNRLDGVTTTIYYRDPESGESVLWDAAEYDQENPLSTDAQGGYAWDVPVGQWQVKYEKPGYKTAYSNWLPVPPPQMEVNVAMVSESAPHLNAATVYEKEIRLEFSQYMKRETVSAEQVHVTADGTTVPGAVQPVNLEASFEDSSVSYASVYRFIPETALEGQIQITVDAAVKNYAGISMIETATRSAFTERKPLSLSVPKNVEISVGTSQVVDVTVLPEGSGINRKIIVSSNIPGVINAENGMTDANGVAHIPVRRLLPGSGELRFTLEGTELTTIMTVNYESIPSIETVSVIGRKVQAIIRCSDSNAMIFCAVYHNSGKMLAVRSAQITSESNYQFQFDGQQFDYAKAFIVDSNFCPLCESKRAN